MADINIILSNIGDDGYQTRRNGYFIYTEKVSVEDLQGIWDEDMVLTLSWSLSMDKNEEDIIFQISQNGKDFAFAETTENHYKVHSTLICPAKKEFAQLAVRVKVDKNVYKWSKLEVACPPPPPTFGNNPIIAIPIDSSTCSFKLQLPPFQNPTNRSYISVFVEQTDYEGRKDYCDPIKLGLKTTITIRSVHLAVHKELTKPYDMLTIDIGEAPTKESFSELLNCSYQNAMLSQKEKSIFYVVMTSADDRLTVKRSTLYVVLVPSINDFRTSSLAV
ncbi:PREDICTED: uncharacterized protein LOC108562728 [Nicrophorus vespilloides]|uniref:Uncharacterized protein LOC108562728 n=1 Tax=Nicrophorus vespilloides TaxID=110193 RepID=A0ABM1MPY4_NICVS|nr:PREDICTED: uncharacterized protein LOC108562728 [Nicrophorus vespilloides]